MIADYKNAQFFEFPSDGPLILESGFVLEGAKVAYATYGELNPLRNNAVLVCHALTGSQYVSGHDPLLDRSGWWSKVVGPGLAIDTNKYFVIGSNTIGGCYGSTGPTDVNPRTGHVYGINFPFISIGDMVEAQRRLVSYLGVDKLLAVVGGSAGGMQVLEWARKFPHDFHAAIPIATAGQESPRNIALHEVSRQAIMADPNWHNGRYAEYGKVPELGLSVARMSAHINYMSPERILSRFGRELHEANDKKEFHKPEFKVESYLRNQGARFVNRFDANSYLYLTKAIDHFDLSGGRADGLAMAFRDTDARYCVIAFSSDWLQPPEESRKLVRALNACGADVSFMQISTDNGHDAFLMDEPELFSVMEGFLHATYRARVSSVSEPKNYGKLK